MTDTFFDTRLARQPLIAILRGVTPAEVVAVAETLVKAGFTAIEIPLNSPEPLKSIALLRQHFEGLLSIGAGTVVTTKDVFDTVDAGAEFVLMPNTDSQVIEACHACNLPCIPGFTTVTEAFSAIHAGARMLKFFPAAQLGGDYLKAIRAVLPDLPVFAVGGITAESLGQWCKAGAAGVGTGSQLYTPDVELNTLADRAQTFVSQWQRVTA